MNAKTKGKVTSAPAKGGGGSKQKVKVPSSQKAKATVVVASAKGAKTRAELIALVKKAEDLWWASEQDSWLFTASNHEPSLWCEQLRGIYYGATWSMDYQKEKSVARNVGFNLYSGHFGQAPGDPRSLLGNALFDALLASPEVADPKTPFDWGHLVCGLDSRFTLTGTLTNPAANFCTGIEAMTWIGDLGGGAGMLAFRRLKSPQSRARTIFDVTHDYGSTMNLEGDIAGYLVASDSSEGDLCTPKLKGKNALSTALKEYLNESGSYWKNRAKLFLEIYDGEISGTDLENREEIVGDFAAKLKRFGLIYILIRQMPKGAISDADLPMLLGHLECTSKEIASIFVDELIACMKNPVPPMKPKTDPNPIAAVPDATAKTTIETLRKALKKAGLIK